MGASATAFPLVRNGKTNDLYFEEQFRMLFDHILYRLSSEVSLIKNLMHLLLTVNFLDEKSAKLNHMIGFLCDRSLQH